MIKYVALPNPSITMKHIYEARDIVDSTFANGYFNNHLNEIQCAWVAMDDDTVVGWAAVGDCTLRCVAVHPEYRGQGIGRRLTEERLKYLDYCDEIVSYAWIRPDGRCMSCKNLENFGFKFEKELDDHYSDTRMNCKYCGTGCQCKARLYLKRKEDE